MQSRFKFDKVVLIAAITMIKFFFGLTVTQGVGWLQVFLMTF